MGGKSPDIPEGPDPEKVIKAQARFNRPDTITPFGSVEFRDTAAGPNTEAVLNPSEAQQKIIGGQQQVKQQQLQQALGRLQSLPTPEFDPQATRDKLSKVSGDIALPNAEGENTNILTPDAVDDLSNQEVRRAARATQGVNVQRQSALNFDDAPDQVTNIDTSEFANRQTVDSRSGAIQDASGSLVDASGQVQDQSGSLINASGQVQDQSGSLVDASGQVQDRSGSLVDASGQVQDRSGSLVDASGQVQDQSGSLINASGQITDESGNVARRTSTTTDQIQRTVRSRSDQLQTDVRERTSQLNRDLSRQGLIGIPGAQSGFGEARRRAKQATFERATNLLDERFREREQELRQNLANRGQPATGPAGEEELENLRRSENEALRQASFQAVQEGGQTASRLFNRALQGREQQVGERSREFQLENQATGQAFQQALESGQFGNQAQQAALGQDVRAADFQNQAAQQVFNQNLQANQFQNQASQLAQQLQNNAAQQQQQLNNQSATQDQQLSNQAAQRRQSLANQFATQGQQLSNQAAQRRQSLANQSATQDQQLSNQAAQRRQSLANQFATQDQQLSNQAAQRRQSLANQFATQDQQLSNQAAQRRQSLANELAARDQQLSNQAVNQRQQLDLGAAQNNNAVRDAQLNEALQQAQLQNRGRGQAIDETLQQRNQLLQEIGALQGGAPPTTPEQQPSQPIDVNGPFQAPARRATQAALQGAQSRGNLVGGLLSAGGQIIAAAPSDRRLKTNVEPIGEHRGLGIPWYRWRWTSNSAVATGVMADDVREVMPEAVITDHRGYDMVRYDLIGEP